MSFIIPIKQLRDALIETGLPHSSCKGRIF